MLNLLYEGGSVGRVIASYSKANSVFQMKLGISREQKRTRPGKEFSYKIVISQLLMVE